jgi:hypothetical protein
VGDEFGLIAELSAEFVTFMENVWKRACNLGGKDENVPLDFGETKIANSFSIPRNRP